MLAWSLTVLRRGRSWFDELHKCVMRAMPVSTFENGPRSEDPILFWSLDVTVYFPLCLSRDSTMNVQGTALSWLRRPTVGKCRTGERCADMPRQREKWKEERKWKQERGRG